MVFEWKDQKGAIVWVEGLEGAIVWVEGSEAAIVFHRALPTVLYDDGILFVLFCLLWSH